MSNKSITVELTNGDRKTGTVTGSDWAILTNSNSPSPAVIALGQEGGGTLYINAAAVATFEADAVQPDQQAAPEVTPEAVAPEQQDPQTTEGAAAGAEDA